MESTANSLEGRTTIGGRYEILGLLGAGGMGCVYRARDTRLDDIVALKLLAKELAESPGMLERFRQEVKLARKVTHRNVARTFDLGEEAGEHFLTMELVEGESLSAILAREKRLGVAHALEIAVGVCEGLQAAHAAGVVHRDLKPENVLIGKDGRVVLTDFGIARALEQVGQHTMGGPIGTPAYMAPEQLEASPNVDARADQYAFGVMLFEMLTGALPFTGPSPYAIAAARLMQPPPDPRSVRPDLPEGIANVILRCMARKPDDRFARIEEIASRLGSATLPAVSMGVPSAPTSNPTVASGTKTVAVLPLRNSGSEADDYIAEGVTDDLIDGLSMTPGLRVRPRSSVIHLRGQTRDPRDVGRELGVQVVAEGSVRILGDAARITVRLVSVADGFQLWAKRFDVSKGEVLRAADEAATAIAEALTVERKEGRPILDDPAAVDFYLRGRHEYYKFEFDAVDRAIEFFDRALAVRPNDPLILSAAGMALARTSQFRDTNPELFARARVCAQKALELAPDFAEPRVAMAMVDLHSGNAPSAARHVRQALKRSANLADAHDIAARLLLETGPREAFDHHCDRALALEPRIQMLRYFRCRWAAFDGDREGVDRALAQPPPEHLRVTYWQARFRFVLWSRDGAQAKVFAEKKDVQYPPFIVPMLHAMAAGKFDPAIVADIEARAHAASTPRGAGLFSQIAAEIHGFARNYDRALEFMRRASAANVFDIVWLERCPLFGPIRSMPGYEDVRAEFESRAAQIRDELV